MKNILTFDIEEWFDQNYVGINSNDPELPKGNLEKEMQELLDLCQKYGAKATFFILGRVAVKNPDIVKQIQESGQEIASHGFEHNLIYKLSPEDFKEDLRKSLEVLESITREKILGYRAPSWSLKSEEASWVYPVLKEFGLKYSSSCFPIKTFLYGMPKSPRFPYWVKDILEIPVSTLRLFNQNIAFSGGAYFRFLPYFFISWAIKQVNKEGKPAILYSHPREIDPGAPRLKLPPKESLIHYWGVSQMKEKLEKTLKQFKFGSIKEELLL